MFKKVCRKNAILKMLLLSVVLLPSVFYFPGVHAIAAEKASAAAADKPAEAAKKDVKYEMIGVIESVSLPVNPHETLMVVAGGDSTAVEFIISPSTRFYPRDYYPCPGDKVKVNYVILGVFKKYVIAYGVSLIEEFSGIDKGSYKIINK